VLIVWGAVPFVVITLYAGLAQVPRDLVEAARGRRCAAVAGLPRHHAPILRPILLILTSLSIIWDFGVFTQPYLLIGPIEDHERQLPDEHLPLRRGVIQERLRAWAAISILMLLIVAVLSVAYVRKMVRIGDLQ